MTKPARTTARRKRGEIETLPNGSLRVKVYAGNDALTGKRHYLTEVVAAGPKAEAEAERVRTRLVSQVDEQSNLRAPATVDQLMIGTSNSWTWRTPPEPGTSPRSGRTYARCSAR